MAPDLISDIALLEVSRWQREKLGMSIDCCCKGHENYYECPVNYLECPPTYPVPAIRKDNIENPYYYWHVLWSILFNRLD